MYDLLCKGLRDRQLKLPGLIADTPAHLIEEELESLRKVRKTASGLTSFESSNLKEYYKIMDERQEDVALQVCAVNQNPAAVSKTSRKGILPAFTATDRSGHLWLRCQERPLLAYEKFLGHGWPMSEDLSAILKIPVTLSQRCRWLWVLVGIFGR